MSATYLPCVPIPDSCGAPPLTDRRTGPHRCTQRGALRQVPRVQASLQSWAAAMIEGTKIHVGSTRCCGVTVLYSLSSSDFSLWPSARTASLQRPSMRR